MALTFGCDSSGPWVALSCDSAGCECHIWLRPGEPDDTLDSAVDMAEEAAAIAHGDGWWLVGVTSCPRHALDGFRAMGLMVELGPPQPAQDGRGASEPLSEAVQPEAAAAAAQRGLTAVH